ncbi:MAG: diguanylate cyclase [Desulfobulbaceae bacterium]|nr:diguanylate cyclase [Desulfobulbaceae bacterium]
MPGPLQQTILVIENNPETAASLTKQAIAFGFNVELCDSCATAWSYFQKELPRLVIIECHLPDEESLTLCQQIRGTNKGSYCTILMVANKLPVIDQTRALMAGANYCMDRPVQEAPLSNWFTVAKQGMSDLLSIEQTVDKIDHYKQELEDVNDQLESSIERANQLAMDAEKAYVEINQIFKTVSGGIALINKDCEIIRHNATFLAMAGASASEAKTRKCYETFHSCLCNTPECPLTKIKNGQKRVESQIEKNLPNGEKIYYSIISTPFHGLVGELMGMVEHITDITTRVEAEQALKESEIRYRELSIVDELTGLFNKRHFNETLRQETDRANRYNLPLTMFIMDIDNFKHFNDTYGHAEGDRVLGAMGKIITASIRTTDRGNRYGGEEFTVILPNTTAQDAIPVAERVRLSFAAHDFFPRDGEKVNKTVSLGITQLQPNDTPTSFLKRADKNLYEAKESGKNRYILDSQ